MITTWAFEKVGRQNEAGKLLNQCVEKELQNVVAQWTVDVYNGKQAALADKNCRVLRQWIVNSSKP